jgi:hypothetical protein
MWRNVASRIVFDPEAARREPGMLTKKSLSSSPLSAPLSVVQRDVSCKRGLFALYNVVSL